MTSNDEKTTQVNRLTQAVMELEQTVNQLREENRTLAQMVNEVCGETKTQAKTLSEVARVIILTMTAEKLDGALAEYEPQTVYQRATGVSVKEDERDQG